MKRHGAPQFIFEQGFELCCNKPVFGEKLSRLFVQVGSIFPQFFIENQNGFTDHQPIFSSAKTHDINAAIHSGFFQAAAKCGPCIGYTCTIQMQVQVVFVGKSAQRFHFLGAVNGSQFGSLTN